LSRGTPPPGIIVLAGTNGAGKSSIAGAALRQTGAEYFNPDEATQRIRERHPDLTLAEANSRAWRMGRRLLTRAIDERRPFAFETTLGGRTMTGLLMRAANVGMAVRVWYVGLASADLHVERVRERAARGGHDIDEARIRERYDSSRRNLIALLPYLAELKLFDNSIHGDPAVGERPQPMLVLHLKAGRIVDSCAVRDVPDWAKPVVQAVIGRFGR
jgi:predicted ABC-type ATPase